MIRRWHIAVGIVAVVCTVSCGALFGVDFNDVPPVVADSGQAEGEDDGGLSGGFCQTHSHAFCMDFDENELVPNASKNWGATVASGTVALTTDASVSPPASFDSHLTATTVAADASIVQSEVETAQLTGTFPNVSEVHYELDVRIVSCAKGYATFLADAYTGDVSATLWEYNQNTGYVFFDYLSPLVDAGGGTSTGAGSYEDIALAQVAPGTWIHLAADVTYTRGGGPTHYSVSMSSLDGAGLDAGTIASVSGPGLDEPENTFLSVDVGLEGATDCEVEIDNYTLDYTAVDAG